MVRKEAETWAMDSDNEEFLPASLNRPCMPSVSNPSDWSTMIVRQQWKLIGMSPEELRNIEVDRGVQNTCESFDALPDEIKDVILRYVIGFHMYEENDEDIVYYNIRYAQLLSNMSTAMWRLMHQLPHINYESKSINEISIYAPSEAIDTDGDPLEQKCGNFNGKLRVFKNATGQRSDLWEKPLLIGTGIKFELSMRSFVNNQLTNNEESTIVEVESTFELDKRIMEFTHDDFKKSVNKWAPIRYETTTTRTYMPMGPVEIDEQDGKAWVDDEAPRRLLLTSATPNEDLKGTNGYPFTVTVDRYQFSPTVRFQPKGRVATALGISSNSLYYSIYYDARELLAIFNHPIDMVKCQMHHTERAARKRCMQLIKEVGEMEKETNILKEMQDHDEESIERTKEKRLKAASTAAPASPTTSTVSTAPTAPTAASDAGTSSGVTSFESRLHAYIAARARRLKTEYEQLMGDLGGDNDAMIISQLKEVEGRIAEILSLRGLM